MTLRVETHYAGSRCVVWRNREHYVDVRKDTRSDRYEVAECVRYGQVYRRVHIDMAHDAPNQLLQLIREELT